VESPPGSHTWASGSLAFPASLSSPLQESLPLSMQALLISDWPGYTRRHSFWSEWWEGLREHLLCVGHHGRLLTIIII
jgi:hypothetical protein